MERIIEIITEHENVINMIKNDVQKIKTIAAEITETLKRGNKILVMGNGGSAADSQHLAAEIVGRFKKERKGLPAVSLTTDTSILTAVGNDYGFDHVFSRQIEALAVKGDAVVCFSTSGSSRNVIRGAEEAAKQGCKTIGFLGRDGGELKDLCDLSIVVPAENTARVQEAHLLIYHIICEMIDLAY